MKTTSQEQTCVTGSSSWFRGGKKENYDTLDPDIFYLFFLFKSVRGQRRPNVTSNESEINE